MLLFIWKSNGIYSFTSCQHKTNELNYKNLLKLYSKKIFIELAAASQVASLFISYNHSC